MERKLRRIGLSLLFLMAVACHHPTKQKQQHPNVILIMTDDQGWGDLSINGNDSIETPRLDQLAREGAQFEQFYVSPVCAPTRASLLTGRYHLRTGTSWVTHRKEVMREEEVTLAEVFKENGYRTGLFGKWHNGMQYPNTPLGQGFDRFFGFCAGHWDNYFDTKLTDQDQQVETEGYITDVLTDKAIEFIQKNKEQPFFCYVPYNTPHSPFQVPDQYFNKYKSKGLTDKNACVYGMCENIDDNVGRVLDTLSALNLADNTIVIFLSDNGPNGKRFNGNLRGKKAQVYEGGVRVPFLMRWPSQIAANQTIQQLGGHIDVLPTLAKLCDLNIPNSLQLDGIDLSPWLLEDTPIDSARTYYTVFNEGEQRHWPGSIRNQQFSLVVFENHVELYDLITDRGQQYDLADSLPSIASQMQKAYEVWYQDVAKAGFDALPVPLGYKEHRYAELPAHEGQLNGNVAFSGGRGWAGDWSVNWIEIGDQISWDLAVHTAGDYQVEVIYSATEEVVNKGLMIEIDSQKLPFAIQQPFMNEQIPSPDRVKRGEVYEQTWGIQDAGMIHLPVGEASITLKLVDKLPKTAQLNIKGIKLRKVPK